MFPPNAKVGWQLNPHNFKERKLVQKFLRDWWDGYPPPFPPRLKLGFPFRLRLHYAKTVRKYWLEMAV